MNYTTITKWSVSSNKPGFMPDEPAEHHYKWGDAMFQLMIDLRSLADEIDEWEGERDDDDASARAHAEAIIRDELVPLSNGAIWSGTFGETFFEKEFTLQPVTYTRVFVLGWSPTVDALDEGRAVIGGFDWWWEKRDLEARFPNTLCDMEDYVYHIFAVDIPGDARYATKTLTATEVTEEVEKVFREYN